MVKVAESFLKDIRFQFAHKAFTKKKVFLSCDNKIELSILKSKICVKENRHCTLSKTQQEAWAWQHCAEGLHYFFTGGESCQSNGNIAYS